MGTIISSGVGSGLDVAGLVSKLVQAEGAPKAAQLDQAEAKVQAKLSALGSLRSALASFRDSLTVLKDASKFQGRQATLSTPDFLTASASATAVPGSYSIVVDQLASAHKLQSRDFLGGADDIVGTGTLQIAAGGEVFQIEIDAESNTLAGVAAAINASAASAKVQATVITGSGAARLTITARNSGADNALVITQSGGDGGLAALEFPHSGSGLNEIAEALDARAFIDGLLVTSSTNTISGAISGVDLTLVAGSEGEATEVAIGYDRTAARATVDSFVKSYNALVDSLKKLTSYNAETRQGGPLFGDGGVRNLVDQLRRELSASVGQGDAEYDSLARIGITVQLDGQLAVDGTELDAAFTADFDAIGELFGTEETGLAVKLDALLEPYLASQGVFDSRTASLKSSIEAIADRREALNQRLVALQARYTKQFNALDSLLAQLQGTSNFLAQQLGNLPGSAPLTRNQR
jgi:flagellar hook-associated protein 2